MRAALLLLALSSAASADWLLFRGDAGQTGASKAKLPDKLGVLWQFKCNQDEGGFEGTAAIVGDLVLAGSTDEHLYAVDLKTGKEKWKQKWGPIKGAPLVKGKTAYAGDLDGGLHAFTLEGKKLWKFEANSEIGGVNSDSGLLLASSHDEHLYAVDADGKQKWKFQTNGPIYGAVAVSQGKTFLVGCDSKLHVIDIKTGKEDREVDIGGQTGGTAAVQGEMLYVGTMKNEVLAIDWKKGEIKWSYKPPRGEAFFSSPALHPKHVVIGSRDKKVHCIDRETGKEAWTFKTGNKVDASPVIVGERVYIGSLDGTLYVLGLKSGEVLQKIALDGPINASPAVSGGRLVVGTQKGTLYCLGAK
ncbi:MAG: PQQ-binding-like beta-propeller repeat protein [Gemmataceae bacterium]|nr:PQQ-binding-like beta-propeller repeat protein [Gemmataceae bacterium]